MLHTPFDKHPSCKPNCWQGGRTQADIYQRWRRCSESPKLSWYRSTMLSDVVLLCCHPMRSAWWCFRLILPATWDKAQYSRYVYTTLMSKLLRTYSTYWVARTSYLCTPQDTEKRFSKRETLGKTNKKTTWRIGPSPPTHNPVNEFVCCYAMCTLIHCEDVTSYLVFQTSFWCRKERWRKGHPF